MLHDPRDPVAMLSDELVQLRLRGFDVADLDERAAEGVA